jgi:hypothetical protein
MLICYYFEDKFLLWGGIRINRQYWFGEEDVDSIFDEDPSFLRAWEKVEVIGFIFELKIGLHNKAEEDIEKANVVNEESHGEIKLPA